MVFIPCVPFVLVNAGQGGIWHATSFVPVARRRYKKLRALIPGDKDELVTQLPSTWNLEEAVAAATFEADVMGTPVKLLHIARGIPIRLEDFRVVAALVERLADTKFERGSGKKDVSIEFPSYALYRALRSSLWPDPVQDLLTNPLGHGGTRIPDFNKLRVDIAFGEALNHFCCSCDFPRFRRAIPLSLGIFFLLAAMVKVIYDHRRWNRPGTSSSSKKKGQQSFNIKEETEHFKRFVSTKCFCDCSLRGHS